MCIVSLKKRMTRDHCTMPYVYWLPPDAKRRALGVQERADCFRDERQKLADWNAGKPMSGGIHHA